MASKQDKRPRASNGRFVKKRSAAARTSVSHAGVSSARAQGARSEPDMVREFAGVRVDLATRAVLRPDGAPGEELTETELSVLRVLAENLDRIVSREALHPVVTGEPTPAKPSRAIDTCVSRLRIKLRSGLAPVEIRSVRQAGYLFRRERSARGAGG